MSDATYDKGPMTPEDMDYVMAAEEAASGAPVQTGMPRERQGPSEMDKQIAQFQEIIAAINAGTYPGDVAEVQQIFDNLPPEIQSRVLSTVAPDLESASGAPVQPEYFGALPGDPGMGPSAAQASGAPMPGAAGPMMPGAAGPMMPGAAGPALGAVSDAEAARLGASMPRPNGAPKGAAQDYLENLERMQQPRGGR
tara:strand:- start:158 stop:745 length:588 start_codon:yes stop_codon:yes gene_type:complete